jgi:AcrR family transcriptional regulator
MADPTTRELIVEAADLLFYQRGFDHTSFADIADVVGISRGNFYFHFKTKDEILDAVIAQRVADTRAMLDGWERDTLDPAERIRSFINIVVTNRAKIKRFGCPVGSLTSELAKLDHDSRSHAREIFSLFREWLRQQFAGLGCEKEADANAMHLLARSQGVATLMNAFRDDQFIRDEVAQMNEWLACRIERAAVLARVGRAVTDTPNQRKGP